MDITFNKYVKQTPDLSEKKLDSLIGRKFTFNVISEEKNYIEVAENVFIAGIGFPPVFKSTIVKVMHTNFPFLIIGPIERISISSQGKVEPEPKISMENRAKLVEQAIHNNSIEEFSKYLNEDLYNSESWDDISEIIYEYGKPKIIEIILNKGFWESDMFISLVGRSDVVKYLISRNVPIPVEALIEAGKLGYSKIVKMLVFETKTVPEYVLRDIIRDSLDYETREEDILTIVKLLYHDNLTEYDMEDVVSLGPSIVKYLLENNAPANTRVVRAAIEIEDLEIVKILLEHKVPVDEVTTAFSFTTDSKTRLQIAKYLFENGSYIDSTAVKAAAESGNLEGVKYLIRNNAPIDSEVMNIAVGSWKLEDIKYLFENNVPVDNKTVLASAMKNRKVLDVVEYLLKKDIPITDAAVRAADKRGHIELARYLYQTSFEQEMKDTIPVRDISSILLEYLPLKLKSTKPRLKLGLKRSFKRLRFPRPKMSRRPRSLKRPGLK